MEHVAGFFPSGLRLVRAFEGVSPPRSVFSRGKGDKTCSNARSPFVCFFNLLQKIRKPFFHHQILVYSGIALLTKHTLLFTNLNPPN
jgi:hypothetical protein